MKIVNTLEIAAPVQTVWDLTLDVESWPRVTPTTMTTVELMQLGPLAIGSRARIKQPGQKLKIWAVTELESQRCFAWQANQRGLAVTGRHVLEPTPTGTRNVLTVELTGPLSRLVGLLGGRAIRRTIDTENRSFKAAAEARSAVVG